jgi:hypothetical protein
MTDNFRIKYLFEGKEYSSGVSDVFRDKTIYHIFYPVELRSPYRLGPQFITVYQEGGEYKADFSSKLATTMFAAFLEYMNKHAVK